MQAIDGTIQKSFRNMLEFYGRLCYIVTNQVHCGCSLSVELRLPKPIRWVRLPSSAPEGCSPGWISLGSIFELKKKAHLSVHKTGVSEEAPVFQNRIPCHAEPGGKNEKGKNACRHHRCRRNQRYLSEEYDHSVLRYAEGRQHRCKESRTCREACSGVRTGDQSLQYRPAVVRPGGRHGCGADTGRDACGADPQGAAGREACLYREDHCRQP